MIRDLTDEEARRTKEAAVEAGREVALRGFRIGPVARRHMAAGHPDLVLEDKGRVFVTRLPGHCGA